MGKSSVSASCLMVLYQYVNVIRCQFTEPEEESQIAEPDLSRRRQCRMAKVSRGCKDIIK